MKKALLVIILVSTATCVTWRWMSDDAPVDATAENLTLDRLWVDHLPKHDRDTIQVFAALTEHPVGIFQAASQWQGAYEIFLFEAHGDEMRLHFPHSGDREKVKSKARECNEAGWDYCLELKGSKRGVKRYYSMTGWELDGVRDADALERHTAAFLDRLATD